MSYKSKVVWAEFSTLSYVVCTKTLSDLKIQPRFSPANISLSVIMVSKLKKKIEFSSIREKS